MILWLGECLSLGSIFLRFWSLKKLGGGWTACESHASHVQRWVSIKLSKGFSMKVGVHQCSVLIFLFIMILQVINCNSKSFVHWNSCMLTICIARLTQRIRGKVLNMKATLKLQKSNCKPHMTNAFVCKEECRTCLPWGKVAELNIQKR